MKHERHGSFIWVGFSIDGSYGLINIEDFNIMVKMCEIKDNTIIDSYKKYSMIFNINNIFTEASLFNCLENGNYIKFLKNIYHSKDINRKLIDNDVDCKFKERFFINFNYGNLLRYGIIL